MRRRILLIVASVLAFAGCTQSLGEFFVTPTTLEFDGKSGTKLISVTSADPWSLSISDGTTWLSTSMKSAKASSVVDVSVTANSTEPRAAEIVFTCSGQTIKVTVNQAAGTGEVPETEKVSPDPTSGITVEPSYPDADQPCTIVFKPAAGNPLRGHSGELYGHFGVVVDGEWTFVPTEWGTADEKTHFTKVADNHWEFKMEPSIREYFNSGTTPVSKIALIVRSEDGTIKSHDADQFCSVSDTKYKEDVFVSDPIVTETMPADVKHGINYNADGSVTFVFYDKDTAGKSHTYCYIVGDWNNWERVTEGAMKRDDSAGCWWITLGGFDADKEYRFQYRLGTDSGSDIRVSDPYTEIVYDQWNDQYISGTPAFPEKAKGLVSAFQISRPEYNWKHSDFKVEDKNDLVIYEMLFRDFTNTQDIAGAMAQLDYIENLGVNAIELMPIQEFDANLSWGYNPNHWFALDKYYGTREEYKDFIDECHGRGIAVIVDVVYNHATGSHPWTKMYWDTANNRTAANNPWFNAIAKHPYNVYHDMNHENEIVQEHVKRSLQYLLEEYDIDGFRFDLTKGFTQNNTGEDVAAWGRYDASRVSILKGYADHIWSVKDDAVVIFEHLSDWDEEKALAEHGIQLWRNVNYQYRTAVSGGNGNFTDMYSTAPFGGFVGYMESHDEERLCYGATADASSVTWGVIGLGDKWGENDDIKMTADGSLLSAKNVSVAAKDRFKIRKAGEWNDAYNYGASSDNFTLTVGQGYVMTNGSSSKDMYVPAAGTYDIYFSPEQETVWLMKQGDKPELTGGSGSESEDALTVAMRRAGASAAFFLTVPGPKMIWQFGEIGYDYSIDYNDRTGEKPVVTSEYMAVPERKVLYDTYASLLKFRRDNPRFFDQDADFTWTPSAAVKTITCSADGKTFHVVGNFGKSSTTYSVPSGNWKDYFADGASVTGDVVLKPGDFRLLTNF